MILSVNMDGSAQCYHTPHDSFSSRTTDFARYVSRCPSKEIRAHGQSKCAVDEILTPKKLLTYQLVL